MYHNIRRFRLTIVAVEKQELLNILSVCLYPCLSYHGKQIASFPRPKVLSSVAFLALIYVRIFPHYLINSTIFGRKLLNIKCVFLLYLQPCLKHFLF
jgi:hypothetical protein